MRPSVTRLRPDCAWLAENRAEFILQPKLNGDRVVLWIERDGWTAQNRHGSRYSFRIRNAADFAALPSGTVLDGEVIGSNFYPFDVLRIGDLDLTGAPVENRIGAVKSLCAACRVEWRYSEPTPAQLVQWETDYPLTREVEGVVAKRKGSKYQIHAKPFHEADDWLKFKW